MDLKVLKTKKGIIAALVLVLILAGLAALAYHRLAAKKNAAVEGGREAEVVPVRVAEAAVVDLQHVLDLTGELKPAAAVEVYPKVSGKIIQEILVEMGDFVSEGSLIAVFDDSTVRAQLEEATAALAAAEAGVKQSERNIEASNANLNLSRANLELIEKERRRVEFLYQAGAVSEQEFDRVNSQYEVAEAQYNAAEAQYKAASEAKSAAMAQAKRAEATINQLQIVINDHKLYAPISGVVAARYAERGGLTSQSQPVVRISREDELKIVCSVTEKDFPAVKKGMKAEITVDALPGKVFWGEVSLISPTIDPSTRTAQVEIRIPNQNYELRSGMYARIKLYLGERKALAVPSQSVSKMTGTANYYVYVVENGKAVMRNIKTGITQNNLTEVTEGLNEGEQVVTRGQSRLFDGAPVSVEEREVVGSEAS